MRERREEDIPTWVYDYAFPLYDNYVKYGLNYVTISDLIAITFVLFIFRTQRVCKDIQQINPTEQNTEINAND